MERSEDFGLDDDKSTTWEGKGHRLLSAWESGPGMETEEKPDH